MIFAIFSSGRRGKVHRRKEFVEGQAYHISAGRCAPEVGILAGNGEHDAGKVVGVYTVITTVSNPSGSRDPDRTRTMDSQRRQ
jgi:hypothetical protein